MTVSALIVGLYILLLFAISWASKRLTTGKAENYVLAGRRMTTPLITVSIVGLAVGGRPISFSRFGRLQAGPSLRRD